MYRYLYKYSSIIHNIYIVNAINTTIHLAMSGICYFELVKFVTVIIEHIRQNNPVTVN